MISPQQHARLLVVEDQEGEQELLAHALSEQGVLEVTRMEPGMEGALRYLRDGISLPEPALPELILLDLKLKNGSGLELLRALRATPHFAHLPVLILTTSDDARDMRASYMAGVNGYVTKPGTLAALTALIGDICRYWLSWNQTPKAERSHPAFQMPGKDR